MSKYKKYIISGLILLFMSTFPLFLGWIPIGAFRPRFLLMILTILYLPNIFRKRPIAYLLLFSAYTLFMQILWGEFNVSTYLSDFMDYALPTFMAMAVFHADSFKLFKIVAVYAVIVTTFIIINNIYTSTIYPNAIRGMVGATAFNDTGMAELYQRWGVCIYGFAAMAMTFPTVAVCLAKSTSRKKIQFLCYTFAALSFVFLYIAGVTTPLLISLIILFFAIFLKEISFLRVGVIGIVVLLIFPAVLEVLSNLSILEGTNFETRINDVSTYTSTGRVEDDSDISSRFDLMAKSLHVFINNPLFGNLVAERGGHNYLLDMLAKYGLIGFTLFAVFIKNTISCMMSKIPFVQRGAYIFCILSLLILSCLKNLTGTEYWLYTFLYIPCVLIAFPKQDSAQQVNRRCVKRTVCNPASLKGIYVKKGSL